MGQDTTETWHRLHPLSPLARGWIALAVVVGVWLNTVVNGLVDDATGRRDESESGPESLPPILDFIATMPNWMFYGAMALVGAVIAGVGAVYVWWFTRYQVTDTHVRLRTGLVFRQERQTRLDRVQALDIQRPLVPRLMGLAELRFEVADSGETSVVLRYLKHADARRLRKDLLGAIGTGAASGKAQTAGSAPSGGGASSLRGAGESGNAIGLDEAGEDEQLILSLPLRRVIAARLLTVSFLVLCAAVVAVTVLAFLFPRVILAMLVGFVPTALALGGVVFKALEVSWGFKMFRTPEGVRLRYGLLNKTSQTVPTGRIQALALYRPPLWRWAGWSLVHVNIAGYGGELDGSSAGSRAVLLPVATDADLELLFAQALEVPDAGHLSGLAVEGLVGEAVPTSRFHNSPRRARWVSPVVRCRYGYAVTDHMVVARAGRAYRMCFVVPHSKIQSIGLDRGPILRRLRLADVNLHSIAGPVRAFVARMDQAEAEEFLVQQLARGRAALAVAADPQAHSSSGAHPWGSGAHSDPHDAVSGRSSPAPLPWARTKAPVYGRPAAPGATAPGVAAPGTAVQGNSFAPTSPSDNTLLNSVHHPGATT
ncbi:PH domain-containing protein [Kocuria sp.]|uniref:PH domain-containing protein n=1 Tax=Kocuria sp. TaxID=1871328 RepID=UPI0026E029D1|nr:PH domain-containing protein [Kocuria sp.]MDO5617929.1 PH domain-containing protein [Kocuria sp.]